MSIQQFTNPVYEGYLADPYCWFHEGVYYAVGTGRIETDHHPAIELAVPLIKSVDLQNWVDCGKVLKVPHVEREGCIWAPEIAYHDRSFNMYYHADGEGKGFHIRCATSKLPEGPFIDCGTPLTDLSQNDFAIDSHAFLDDDGQWYLFYATDFHDFDSATFRGTTIVADRLTKMNELAGEPYPIVRAHWLWQRYETGRTVHGVTADWYTIEGPTVVKRKGKYYCFYSGGCFQDETYGVDYLVADSVLGPWKEVGKERGPQIMRTIPGEVIGPGHNSIVTSREGQDYIVYHAWNAEMTARQMWVDPLLWTENGPKVERFRSYIESL
jgi:beta-xylosidase